MMPVLSAFAGPSPICCAVFVQMEHCADTSVENTINIIKPAKTTNARFMAFKLSGKVTTNTRTMSTLVQ